MFVAVGAHFGCMHGIARVFGRFDLRAAAGWLPRGWIGTEHEKLAFYTDSLRRPDAETIEALLRDVGQQGDWEHILEKDRVIGLRRGQASVTLEPGGQLELSGAPLQTVVETQAELEDHLDAVTRAGASLGVGFLGLGFDPLWTVADVPRMPKERYRIMREYMPTVGTLGHDMMFRSCTIQVNLDFESEEDMVTKFRVSLALQNIAGALFANSPFKDGADTGFASIRLNAWTDTDNARCGRLPWVFEPDMGFEKYVDYVLDVPLYFIYRDGTYHRPAAGVTFRQFMDGHPAAQSLRDAGLEATQEDWDLHLTTVFPDVRLKQFLEMRGADSGPLDMMLALPALWVGLLYDSDALARAAALVADWTPEELDALRSDVPRLGLKMPFRGATVRE
ncbi:GCS2 glutamate-cysteine ligase, partial [Helicosporidium sp. ATCC 50920]